MSIIHKIKHRSTAIIDFSLLLWSKQILDVILCQQGAAKNAHDLAYIPVGLEVMLNDCDKAVGNDDLGDLDIYNVHAIAPKVLHSEMLLDGFEENSTVHLFL